MKSIALRILIIAAAVSSHAVAQVAKQITSLPAVITKPGRYVLSKDLVLKKVADAAITINSDDVKLDLGGHVISQTEAAGSNVYGIHSPFCGGISVFNGTIRGFNFGIRINCYQSAATDLTIENLRVEACQSVGIAAAGLSGTVRGFLGRVPTLHLGRYVMRSVLTSYPDAGDVHRRIDVPRNGNVGYELLKRFSLVIDYPHRRLLLRPNTKFHEPFEHDMSGLDLLATGADYRRFLVLRVLPGSPAATAGLEADEELLTVNFFPVNVFSLTQLDRMLHSEDGRVLLLVLRRPDGNLHTTTLRLKRQI